MRLWLSSLLALALASGSAAAQSTAPVTFERFSPNVNGKGLFSAESGDTLEEWTPSVGIVPHYQRDPVRQTGTRLSLLSHRLTADFVLAAGILRWLEVSMGLPMIIVNERGSAIGAAGGLLGPGPMRFGLKLRLTNEADDGVGIAFSASGAVPVGPADAFLTEDSGVFSPALLIEKHFASAFRVLVNIGYTVRNGVRYRNVVIDDEIWWRFGFGWKARPNIEIGFELNGATAAGNPLAGEIFEKVSGGNPLEALFGFRYLFDGGAQIMLGAGPGLNTGFGTPIFRMFAGFMYSPGDKDTDGDGIFDKQDRCPMQPGPRENQGCPAVDADHDGIPDAQDKCPTQAGPKENQGCPTALDSDGDGVNDKEDHCPQTPGPKENHGCPWPDRDKDGVLDKDDKCPDEPGPADNQGCPKKEPPVAAADRDGDGVPDAEDKCPDKAGPKENKGCPWPDRDSDGVSDKDDDCPDQAGTDGKGCPTKGPKITKTGVQIDGRVQFRSGRSTIRKGATRKVLDEVAGLLVMHRELKKIEIRGHTDDLGDDTQNRKLSQRRANAVQRYFVKKGVAEGRLVAKGYGEDEPLVKIDEAKMSKQELAAARVKNRRVEFKILERE